MPSASASMATAVNPGFFRSSRKPKRASRRRFITEMSSVTGRASRNARAARSSLVPQRDHRIDSGCPPRGDKTSEGSHAQQQERDAGKRDRIRRTNAVKQTRQNLSCCERARQTDADADEGHYQAFPHNPTEYIPVFCAESHAKADFRRALAHKEGERAIDADRREQQSQPS